LPLEPNIGLPGSEPPQHIATESEVEIQRSLEARGFLLKSMPPSQLLDVIRQVNAGQK
jgi:DNA-binding NarL/FixJ family response regulator